MSTNVKPKKLGFGKGLILIAAILIVLHWVSDGKSTEFIKDIFRDTTDSTGTTAAPTTPPQADRLPSVPEELWDHVYLDTRGQGSCARFTGNVTVLFVFADDPQTQWTLEEIESTKQEIEPILARIRQDAAAFGATLNLTADYVTGTAEKPLVRDEWFSWATDILQSLSLLDTPSTLPADYRQHYQADAVPILFLTNQDGRSLARSTISGGSTIEGALIYDDPGAIYHELCHVFGAKDFYFPAEVKTLAQLHIPNSIMADSNSGSVDSLTAYLMGWTDNLSNEALLFLNQTAYLTPEYLMAQKLLESHTGYVENHALGDGIYTGYLVDGIRHGQGKYTHDGTVLEGTFVHGSLQGQGTHIWADGTKYIGNFENGKRSGQGIMYYNDGAVYQGQWADSKRSGQGRLTYANGTYCEGTWVDGNLNGEGIFVWSENEKYVGHFVDGKRNGYGIYYFPNGARYEGNWVDGERQGQGTVYYADGSSQSGTWVNGELAE